VSECVGFNITLDTQWITDLLCVECDVKEDHFGDDAVTALVHITWFTLTNDVKK